MTIAPSVRAVSPPRSHSLRGRLALLFAIVCAATIAAAALMYALFQQSAAAQAGQAAAELARACEGVGMRFRALRAAGFDSAAATGEDGRRQLTQAVVEALRHRPGVEGGIRRDGASLAYAYPTYQGSGPKTDEPAAELPVLNEINAAALAQNGPVPRRIDYPTQILLADACPLSQNAPGYTAWVMTRVETFAGPKYILLMTGVLVLLVTLAGAAALLAQIVANFTRRVAAIEATLGGENIETLPELAPTGVSELDRIVRALNDLRRRLAAAREQTETARAQLAASERLAALGRVSAGLAHEIRNPIAAMRLRAETALASGPERQQSALRKSIEHIDRLDGLVSRLLRTNSQTRPKPARVAVGPFLKQCAEACAAAARARGVALKSGSEVDYGQFDPDQMRDAMVNLIENAVQAAPPRSAIEIGARREEDNLVFSVADAGGGLVADVRARLFEPFNTSRPEAAGLGLAVVREIARAHRGTARLARDGADGVTFEIALPCPSF